jgi:dCTP deaminase
MSAGPVQPGTRNRQLLEVNLSPAPIALYSGTRICQLVLESVQGRAKYKGRSDIKENHSQGILIKKDLI